MISQWSVNEHSMISQGLVNDQSIISQWSVNDKQINDKRWSQECLPRVPECDQQSPAGPGLHHQLSLEPRLATILHFLIFR